jgi:hypothetical protein
MMPAYDSCVSCSFEETIKNYLVSKGIKEDRVVCDYNTESTKDQENNLSKIRKAHPLNEVVLFVNESVP